jgi:hypothetical protein
MPIVRFVPTRIVYVAVSIAIALVAGCGGNDSRPEVAVDPATPERTTSRSTSTSTSTSSPQTAGGDAPIASSVSTSLPATQTRAIAGHAADTASALQRWDRELAACIGPSGDGDDAEATCTRAAWEGLFRRMHGVHGGLLDILAGIAVGRCHEALGTAVDAVHGFLAGGTPTNVVWLDEQQRPPSRFDLDTLVDLVRPVPVRMREALATACSG